MLLRVLKCPAAWTTFRLRRRRCSCQLSITGGKTIQQVRHGSHFNITPELGKKLQIDALRRAKPARLSQLITAAQCWPALQHIICQQLQKELRTRIGHQIIRLQHVLPPSKGCASLSTLHIDLYEQLWAIDEPMNALSTKGTAPPVLFDNFQNLMSSVEGRLSTVTETLMEGLKETMRNDSSSASREIIGLEQTNVIVTQEVDRFLQARIGISTLVRHFLDMSKDPKSVPFVPPSSPRPDQDAKELSTMMNVPYGAILQNGSIRELVEDCRAEVDSISEHYFQERIPHVNIVEEGEGAIATIVPAHLHHMLFEVMKNAYKATVESAARRNTNTLTPIQIRIFPGEDEICVRVRDYGDGMSLKTIDRATNYLWSSSVPYEKQMEVQQSFQPLTEPMTGMGIGLPVSRLYARHWGGDIRLISIQGWGTDVGIYLSRKDVHEAIPIRCFD